MYAVCLWKKEIALKLPRNGSTIIEQSIVDSSISPDVMATRIDSRRDISARKFASHLDEEVGYFVPFLNRKIFVKFILKFLDENRDLQHLQSTRSMLGLPD